VLKLDVAFLYDLLGASQEHKIKPKKFAQTGHRRGSSSGTPTSPSIADSRTTSSMGGPAGPHGEDRHPVRDRPAGRGEDLREGLHADKVKGKHIAPHTVEVAAMWGRADAAEPAQARPRCPCCRR